MEFYGNSVAEIKIARAVLEGFGGVSLRSRARDFVAFISTFCLENLIFNGYIVFNKKYNMYVKMSFIILI